MTDEFSIIDQYFAPLSAEIGDDCAILDCAPGERLAISTDTQVCGRHFPMDAPPDQLAYRALVAALSDLAAMGARPRGVTLALTLPEAEHSFLQQFSRGVQQALDDYSLTLLGGDTTGGPLTITYTVIGALPPDRALKRDGAQPGDRVYISGTPGDAAAALTVIEGCWPGHSRFKEYLLGRYYRPTARIELGRQLLGLASSAIDVSDGLLADAGHICKRSGVSIRIDSAKLPLSPALASLADRKPALEWALGGGDDYELLFTVPPGLESELPGGCTCIGEVVPGQGVHCDLAVGSAGYRHFQALVDHAGSEPETVPGGTARD